VKVRGAAAPKEPMTYAGLRYEHWSWDLSRGRGGAIRLGLEPLSWGLSLNVRIGASRLGLEPQGWD